MVSKVHTTNDFNAFIEVAEDCPVKKAQTPPQKEAGKTAATIQYEMLEGHPYEYTSDDALFAVHAEKNALAKKDLVKERAAFFLKGQPCFRASPLPKRYGWGVHSDAQGRIAIYPMESSMYQKLAKDKKLKHVKAMRSARREK